MALIQLGIIVNSKGLAGGLNLANPLKNIYLPAGVSVLVGYNSNFAKEYTLSEVFFTDNNKVDSKKQSTKRYATLFLEGVCSKEDSEKLKENAVFISKNLILKYNQDYIFKEDILDCNVVDDIQNTSVGVIVDVWEMPANDVWIVQNAKGKLPIPVIESVIKHCDFTNKTIKINMLDGLEELMFQ